MKSSVLLMIFGVLLVIQSVKSDQDFDDEDEGDDDYNDEDYPEEDLDYEDEDYDMEGWMDDEPHIEL